MNLTDDPVIHLITSDYNYSLDYNDSIDFNYDYSPCTDSTTILGYNSMSALISVVFMAGLVGNSIVVLILTRHIKMKNMTDVCMLNLAISDLLLVLSLPFWACYVSGQGFLSDALCKFITGLYLIGFYSSIFFVTLMSIDRYLAIVHAIFAMRARTLLYGTIASIVIWSVAICASIPDFVFTEVIIEDNAAACQPNYPSNNEKTWKLLRNFEANILGLLIPLIIMTYCYVSILIVLLRSKTSKRHKAIKLIFMIVGVFIVFWVPYNITLFLESLQELNIGKNCGNSQKVIFARDVTEAISLVHCCVNPVIYVFAGEKFKKHLGNLFYRLTFCISFCKRTTIRIRVSENETSNTPV
ncbi:C-C chemokine receptor type 4 [Huso huso]|uniref:C-C chemokine receptor type 4 n=1 Tax=Huso huso TaxID=61971 RepID=A0ABR1A3F6_HUSHU